jgi:hypothetical protein
MWRSRGEVEEDPSLAWAGWWAGFGRVDPVGPLPFSVFCFVFFLIFCFLLFVKHLGTKLIQKM